MRSCPACAARAQRSYGSLHERPYVRCTRCKTVFVEPLPTEDEVTALYPDSYASDRGHGEEPSITTAKQHTFSRYLERLGPAHGRRLLEVGCSTGDALLVARALGYRVQGIEPNRRAATVGQQRLANAAGHPADEVVRCGHLRDVDVPPQDVVALFDVIEHFAAPENELGRIRDLLAPNGCLLALTPDVTSWTARLCKTHWPHFIPEHLTLFSPPGLTALLERCGFRVRELSAAAKYLSSAMLAHHFALYGRSPAAAAVATVASHLPGVAIPVPMGEMVVIADKA